MTRTHSLAILLAVSVALTVAVALPVLAQIPAPGGAASPSDPHGLNTTGGAAGFETSQAKSDLNRIMGLVINWGFSLFGFIFFLFILVGGYMWLTAGSNEDKVKKAKTIIGTAISGLLLVFMAYALANAVVQALINATA